MTAECLGRKSVGFDSGCMDFHNTGGLEGLYMEKVGVIYTFFFVRGDMMRGASFLKMYLTQRF